MPNPKDTMRGRIVIRLEYGDSHLELVEEVEGVDYTSFVDFADTLESATRRIYGFLLPDGHGRG